MQRYYILAKRPNFYRVFLFLTFLLGQCFLVALPAERLVFLCFAQQHALVILNGTVADVGQRTALHADGMYLGDVVGNGAEGRHGAEGYAAEVHVEPGNDDAHATVGQFVADLYQSFVEKLCLVDAHDVDVARQQQDAGRRVEWGRGYGVVVVAHHLFIAIARVDGGFEDFHLLLGKLCTTQTAYQFFGLAREHRAAYYFYSSWAACLARCWICLCIINYELFIIFAHDMGILYIVPTPVGNMEDMTLRAIRILKEADLVLAEDTRTSSHLLKHFDIQQHLLSHHKFNEHGTSASVVDRLLAGQTVALISDAGTPGISDPGFFLVREAVKAGIEVQTLPGATAFVPALVSSGLPCDRFCFEGFLPQKKGRQTKLQSLADEERTMVFYESPYRVLKTLQQFAEVFGPDRQVSACREISKIHEESVRGTLQEVIAHFQAHEPRGEFVLVVAGKS